jgi:hypothetical protein
VDSNHECIHLLKMNKSNGLDLKFEWQILKYKLRSEFVASCGMKSYGIGTILSCYIILQLIGYKPVAWESSLCCAVRPRLELILSRQASLSLSFFGKVISFTSSHFFVGGLRRITNFYHVTLYCVIIFSTTIEKSNFYPQTVIFISILA